MDNEALNKLIINNSLLDELESKMGRFNPFRVLRIEQHEIRHSNVLAWLINPQETHNFKDRIFKRLILRLYSGNENRFPQEFSVTNFQLSSFHDLIVLREWRNIDILAISENQKLAFLIENKIKSRESRNQLERYYEIVKSEYPDFDLIPLYLTLYGDIPENDEKYCSLEHSEVVKIVEHELRLNSEYLPRAIRDFLGHYVESIKGVTDMDESVRKLCQEIYFQHKDAIDLINEVISNQKSGFSEAYEEFLLRHPNLQATIKKTWVLWTAPSEFAAAKKMKGSWNGGYPIALWFHNYNGNLKVILEIGPFDDSQMRINFISALERDGFKVGNWAKRIDSKFTRIFTKYKKVNDWEDKEEIFEVLEYLFSEVRPHSEKVSRLVNSFSW